MRFTEEIYDWSSWGKVYQSIEAFQPLINYIFAKEDLTGGKVKNCTPGTNAVFRCGRYIVKIFAPKESGVYNSMEMETEMFAQHRANRLGIPAPQLCAYGIVKDKYDFPYMVMEAIEGEELDKLVGSLSHEKKLKVGRRLREVTNRMNLPCEPFNDVDVLGDEKRAVRWAHYPESFRQERQDYIKNHDFGSKVYVHGDLCGGNILVNRNLELHIIDFADSALAPIEYEHGLVACELFNFDRALMEGYFGSYTPQDMEELCFNGLLIHDFGGHIVERHLGAAKDFQCLEQLRLKLRDCIQ